MLFTISPSDMISVEIDAISASGMPSLQLMERAAQGVARAAKRYGRALILCGVGNNGGDGMAAARILAASSAKPPIVWLLEGEMTVEARVQHEYLKREVPSVTIVRVSKPIPDLPADVDCVVDALFGTGLSRPLTGVAAALCKAVNASHLPVIAADVPSGLNAATGAATGPVIRATETVTFHRAKDGLYLGVGPSVCGQITVCDIGIPPEADVTGGYALMEESDLTLALPPRARATHKGNYGRVLLVCGSEGMAGAAAISALAALRTGAGLVTVACPRAILPVVQTLCPCATCLPLDEDAQRAWERLRPAVERADALGVGCGLGTETWTNQLLALLLPQIAALNKPAVLDADALNWLAAHAPEALRFTGGQALTPHHAEAARLLGWPVERVAGDSPAAAKALAERFGASVVLKGAVSLLYAKEGAALNPHGTPAMAKGGSGDALTGALAALLAGRAAGAYALCDLTLLQTACALHGLAGERAARLSGERGLLATELCDQLGRVGAEADAPRPKPVAPREAPRPAPADELSPLGRHVRVSVEHRAGERDPANAAMIYRLNCGYVSDVLEEDGEWRDACVIGVKGPLDCFEGVVVARLLGEDGGERWLVAPSGSRISEGQARQAVAFLGLEGSWTVECLE